MEINRINYERFFLLYLDRELNPSEKQGVEKFLAENADLQKEFKLLQQTVLAPQEFVFEPKELLFRKEEKRKIIPFYRIQVAAAVAGLILGSWFIISVIVKNGKSDISGGQSQTNQAKNATVHPDNTTGQSADKTVAENLNAGKETAKIPLKESKTNLNNKVNKSNQSVTLGPDQNDIVKKKSGQNTTSQTGDQHIYPANQNPSINTGFGDNPESASVALQKSSTGLEVQSGSAQTDAKHLTVPGQPAKSAPVLAIAATPNTDASDYENEPMKDQEYQTDNAISVVALNDPSKGISRFFKKLTKRTPEETNARQVRVSVFQISY